MNYAIIIRAAGAVVAAGAFVVAWLNYRTSGKMPNENKFFEEKFSNYRSVIAALNAIAAVSIGCANESLGLKGSAQALRKEKDELNGEVNKAYSLMEDAVYKQTLVLQDEVLERIDEDFDLFDQEDFWEKPQRREKQLRSGIN